MEQLQAHWAQGTRNFRLTGLKAQGRLTFVVVLQHYQFLTDVSECAILAIRPITQSQEKIGSCKESHVMLRYTTLIRRTILMLIEAFPNGGKGGIDFFPQGERLSPREETTFSTQGAKPRGWKQFFLPEGWDFHRGGKSLFLPTRHSGKTFPYVLSICANIRSRVSKSRKIVIPWFPEKKFGISDGVNPAGSGFEIGIWTP